MPDTTPNTEQEAVSTPPVVVDEKKSSPVVAAPQEQKAAVVVEEDAAIEEQEPQEEPEVPRTEFMNLKEALVMGQAQLKRIPHLNPESLRMFLLADLYPILIELADFSNWYIGDLHNRVMGVEMGQDDEFGEESLSPDTAEQLINFIGMSLQIFGVILQSPKADPRLIQTAQLLTTQAPGLMAKVQDITMAEEPDEEEYEDDEEEDFSGDNGQSTESTAVLEPGNREPVQVAVSEDKAKAEAPAETPAETPVETPVETKAEPVAEATETPAAQEPVAEDSKVEEGKSDG